jgi:hypothetical protein
MSEAEKQAERLYPMEGQELTTKNEIYHWLIRHEYSTQIADELASFFAENINLSYKKGQDSQSSRIKELESQLKEKEQQWISVEERLPESNKPVWCFEEPNHQFTGVYTKGHEIPYEDDNYEGCYDPEEDRQGTLLLKAGWYEEVEQVRSEYDFHWIARKVTHWQPLPLVTKP